VGLIILWQIIKRFAKLLLKRASRLQPKASYGQGPVAHMLY